MLNRSTLLLDADQLETVRARWDTEPGSRVLKKFTSAPLDRSDAEIDRLLLRGLLTGDIDEARAAATLLGRFLADYAALARKVLSGNFLDEHQPRPGARETPLFDFSELRPVHRAAYQFDLLRALGVLSPDVERDFGEFLAWCADQYFQPAVAILNARRADRLHNFHADNVTIIAIAALTLPDHPRARIWLRYALEEFEWQMANGVRDGAWHETPRYHGAVLRSYVPLAYALRRCGQADMFANSGFKAMLRWLVDFQAPPDRIYGAWLKQGQRVGMNGGDTMGRLPDFVATLPAIGDGLWENCWYALCAMAAPAYREADPELACALMWAWQRAGMPYAPESRRLIKPMLLIDPSISPHQPKHASVQCGAMGLAALRSGEPDDETYFLLSCGPKRTTHWAGHYHRDQNSFSLFHKGLPLSLDSATGPYGSPVQRMWHKATRSHSTVMFGDCDQDPNDGRIIAFRANERADYVVGAASRSDSLWQFDRHVLHDKRGRYFLIHDFIRSGLPSKWILHSPATKVERDGNRIGLVTDWGVVLDVHVLDPETFDVIDGEGRFGNWTDPDAPGAPPFKTQKWIAIENAPGCDFLILLHPRDANEPPAEVQRRDDGDAVVTFAHGGSHDLLAILAEPAAVRDAISGGAFIGRVGLIDRRTGEATVLAETCLEEPPGP